MNSLYSTFVQPIESEEWPHKSSSPYKPLVSTLKTRVSLFDIALDSSLGQDDFGKKISVTVCQKNLGVSQRFFEKPRRIEISSAA
jgi:hypothetical protein